MARHRRRWGRRRRRARAARRGAVELAGGERRALPVVVPKGAECAFDRARGPGTPVWSTWRSPEHLAEELDDAISAILQAGGVASDDDENQDEDEDD